MKITAKMVKDNYVCFEYYRDKELWYSLVYVDDQGEGHKFLFPVPIDDCGTATFLWKDKAILFMRWMKKYADKLEAEGTDAS